MPLPISVFVKGLSRPAKKVLYGTVYFVPQNLFANGRIFLETRFESVVSVFFFGEGDFLLVLSTVPYRTPS